MHMSDQTVTKSQARLGVVVSTTPELLGSGRLVRGDAPAAWS